MKASKTMTTLGALFILCFASITSWADTDFEVSGQGTVSYVVDGDTAFIKVDDRNTWLSLRNAAISKQAETGRNMNVDRNFKMRFGELTMKVRIGHINTAESNHKDSSRNTKDGAIASQFAKRMFSNDRAAYLCWEIGYYGRPICSVQTHDGYWADQMIESGYATYLTQYGVHPFRHSELANLQ